MFTRQNVRLDKTQPALIVQQGNAPKKHFYLTERSTVIGSARGCDIQVDCDDVAGVHCVITRTASGLSVRDCNSRLGTKVNGVKITESPLRGGDLLQFGLFVFEVSLPPVPNVEDTPVDRSDVYLKRIEALEKSRERLVLLAWHLRRRLLRGRGPARVGAAQGGPEQIGPPSCYALNMDELESEFRRLG